MVFNVYMKNLGLIAMHKDDWNRSAVDAFAHSEYSLLTEGHTQSHHSSDGSDIVNMKRERQVNNISKIDAFGSIAWVFLTVIEMREITMGQ